METCTKSCVRTFLCISLESPVCQLLSFPTAPSQGSRIRTPLTTKNCTAFQWCYNYFRVLKSKSNLGSFPHTHTCSRLLANPYLPSPPTLILWPPLPNSLFPSGSSSHINSQQAAFISSIFRSGYILFLLLDSERCLSAALDPAPFPLHPPVCQCPAGLYPLWVRAPKAWQSSAGQLSPGS